VIDKTVASAEAAVVDVADGAMASPSTSSRA
jgi:hypothetical protein